MEQLSRPFTWRTCAALLTFILASLPSAAQSALQSRIDSDLASDRPIVVHVVVALCDNANQGIVPVPAAIGNGQDPNTNLYWGAMYGVRTYLTRKGGWEKIVTLPAANNAILERAVFHTTVQRGGKKVQVYAVADAWDGAKIKEALQSFLDMAAGHLPENVALGDGAADPVLSAGGNAHLIAFVGHNGLMDFSVERKPNPTPDAPARGAIVLACASKSYFLEYLAAAEAAPVLLTTGLMAPEAYTLDAAIRRWASGAAPSEIVESAAGAYNEYQRCGMKGARRLFWSGPE